MGKISDSPREKPEKKALKEIILSLIFCFFNFDRNACNQKLGEVKFAALVYFYKFARPI